MIINCLAIGAGGALGAVCRYLLTFLPIKMQSGFPVITLGINIIGALCIGLITAIASKNADFDPRLLLFLNVGLCGGFTTFSTFSQEAINLLQSGKFTTAACYIMLSVILCMGAILLANIITSGITINLRSPSEN